MNILSAFAKMGLLLLLPSISSAQQPAKQTYKQLLEQLKQGNYEIDFTALRMASLETGPHQEAPPEPKHRREMLAALAAKNFGGALALAEKTLQSNYLDIRAHLAASEAQANLGNQKRAGFHNLVARGLMKSILDSGDGKTMETAFVVISVDEEENVLGSLGIRPYRRWLEKGKKGQHFDVMEALEQRSQQKVTVYFNISKFFWKMYS